MSTSIIKLHVFSGAQGESPPCYMLQVDEFNFLLDCGWNWEYNASVVSEVGQCARIVDAVLLSHSTMHHLGALAYLVGQCGLNCPIYGTTPVYKMGQLALYDAHQGQAEQGHFQLFSLDHVDSAFELMRPLKYHQNVTLLGKGQGIVITPLPAGNSLGGTIWKIMKDDYLIVYAIDYNHKKERHLNGALFDACLRPQLLITDTRNALYSQTRRRSRDETLLKTLMATLRRGGNVLLAVDTAARCLELAHLLQQLWHNQESGLMAYGLAFLNYVAFNVLDFARSQVEWMSDKVMRSFEDHRTNPFGFRHMQVCHSMEALANVPEPRVVLASQPDLESGFARQLFYQMCEREQDLVILTEYSATGTLARQIVDVLKGGSSLTSELRSREWSLTCTRRVPMSPQEIEEERRNNKVIPPPGSNPITSSLSSGTAVVANQPTQGQNEGSDLLISDSDESDLDEVDEIGSEMNANSNSNVANRSFSRLNSFTSNLNTTLPTATQQRQASVNATASVNSGIRVTNIWNVPSALGSHHHHHYIDSGNVSGPIESSDDQKQTVFDVFLQSNNRGIVKGRCVRGPMLFPFIDKRHYCDSYGEKLDSTILNSFRQNREGFVPLPIPTGRTGRINDIDFNNSRNSISYDKELRHSFSDMKKPSSGRRHSIQPDVPPNNPVNLLNENLVKYVKQSKTVQFKCQILFIDFEGCSDGDAMRKIITSFRPQEIILVRGSPSATAAIAEHCKESLQLSSQLIHTPAVGETVDCTKETHIYQARMMDSLVSSLKFYKIRDYELAWIDANVFLPPVKKRARIADSVDTEERSLVSDSDLVGVEEDREKKRSDMDDSKGTRSVMPILKLPNESAPPHGTVFVNEPKLSDLKTIFLKNGLNAEFFSGVLIVNNCVAVKRTEAGKLLLEGALSNTYHTVRDILFSQFAIL